ncbi:MAG: ABC transporter permease subunit, partial [Haloferacaceae archaeon]
MGNKDRGNGRADAIRARIARALVSALPAAGGRLRSANPAGDGLGKRVALGSAAVSVAVLTLVPLVFLLWSSLWSGYPGDFGGTFTIENYAAVYLRQVYDVTGLFANSLFVAVGMTLIAMTFGLLFAWLFVRTDLPTKGAMELAIVSPYAVPGYVYSIMYIATYGPNNGLVTAYFAWLPGVEWTSNLLFSRWGIAFVVGINAVTSFYLLTAPALQQMDSALEEVGRVHGAGVLSTLRSISFPLILPAILAATTVTFLRGLGEFSVVAILGAPAGFDVYATAIWSAVSLRAPPEYGQAAALSFSLIAVTAVLTWYYRKVTSRKEDYMTVTGREHRSRRWELGEWRWPITIALWCVLFVVWILPVLVMVLVSLHSFWTGVPTAGDLTLSHYAEAVTDPAIGRAFANSVLISVGGATLGTVLVVGTAYYTERT